MNSGAILVLFLWILVILVLFQWNYRFPVPFWWIPDGICGALQSTAQLVQNPDHIHCYHAPFSLSGSLGIVFMPVGYKERTLYFEVHVYIPWTQQLVITDDDFCFIHRTFLL